MAVAQFLESLVVDWQFYIFLEAECGATATTSDSAGAVTSAAGDSHTTAAGQESGDHNSISGGAATTNTSTTGITKDRNQHHYVLRWIIL